ncbi:M35 family metallo-endopeptidase [Loktanella sp. Alg231-35]|uniref:M35 family metallo-endopeptidase n=1 Tax=Loktanella sp. Alg231-35 TaxID=1922220 RepID=UPI000D54FF81|nr:M35 family metallo-endopeptidase [Loktanella sp. Alg231-35]
MRSFVISLLMLWGVAQPAAAQSYQGCNFSEARIIDEAMRSAKDLTLKAAAVVGDTPDYHRWFGTYSQANADEVRANLKAIVTAIRGGGVTAQCDQISQDGCSAGEYAWVYADEPYLIHLCPSFFNLPVLERLQPGSRWSENGTREGTLIHEISHFLRVARTDDHCYSRLICREMASNDATRAIDNADSYQYYTEDVTYFARQPLTNKPPPAPRADR